MKRKDFISKGSLAIAGLSTLFLEACKENPKNNFIEEIPKEHDFSFELDEVTIGLLQEKMSSGQYSSEQITKLYLDHIETIDKNGPNLNSVIELNPDALAIAKSLDEERKAGKVRGPMHGIPILIKDNIDSADKMMTTAGSLALLGNVAKNDAFIVTKLRDSGAVLLGKTNVSEWANFRSTKSCSGWSSRGGQTKNPYILDHNPCGSSAGSGVAVSANLCTVAIGTETDGSVTCPASVNGVVGIKPTVGLLSRSGIIPISFTQDTAGPLARTVQDAAIVLSAMQGIDNNDSKSKESSNKSVSDYTPFLILDGLKGKRIGVEKKIYENHFVHKLFLNAKEVLIKQGAEIVEIDYLSKINASGDSEFELMKYEFKDGLNKYLSNSNSKIKSLKDLIEFNKKNEDTVMPTFKQEIFEQSEAKKGLGSKEYLTALEKSHNGSKKIIDDTLAHHQLDAICGLTMGPACSIDTIYGDRYGDDFLTGPAAMSGYPHISVPCGKVFDLPVGLSFFAGAYQEGQIITLAYAYEQASKYRSKPEFKRSFLA